jgi:hypothetical protein
MTALERTAGALSAEERGRCGPDFILSKEAYDAAADGVLTVNVAEAGTISVPRRPR